MTQKEIIEQTEIMAQNNESLESIVSYYVDKNIEIDTELRKAYASRKITLDGILKYVVNKAQDTLKKNGALWHTTIFGWVLHYIQDLPIEELYEYKSEIKKNDAQVKKEKTLFDMSVSTKNDSEEINLFNINSKQNKTKKDNSKQLTLFDMGDLE